MKAQPAERVLKWFPVLRSSQTSVYLGPTCAIQPIIFSISAWEMSIGSYIQDPTLAFGTGTGNVALMLFD